MRFLKNFFNIIDITRKVFLNLLFILALLLLSITFFVGDVIEDHGPVITFAPKKLMKLLIQQCHSLKEKITLLVCSK